MRMYSEIDIPSMSAAHRICCHAASSMHIQRFFCFCVSGEGGLPAPRREPPWPEGLVILISSFLETCISVYHIIDLYIDRMFLCVILCM